MRHSELTYHLIASDQRLRAARYYASDLGEAELAGATRALAEAVQAGEGTEPNPGLQWVVSLLGTSELEEQVSYILALRFISNLVNALSDDARLETRVAVVEAIRDRIQHHGQWASKPMLRAAVLAGSYERLGDLYLELGQPPRALEYQQKALEICEELRRRAPDSAQYARDLAVSYQRMALCQRALGRNEQAGAYLRRCWEVLRAMRAAAMYMDPPLLALLKVLDRDFPMPLG